MLTLEAKLKLLLSLSSKNKLSPSLEQMAESD